MTSPYEITHEGGTAEEYGLFSNKKLHYTRVTFTGRATGTVTINVKPLHSDRYVAPADNTVDLTATNVWWIKDCPLEGVEIDDTANVAADDLGIVIEQQEWS